MPILAGERVMFDLAIEGVQPTMPLFGICNSVNPWVVNWENGTVQSFTGEDMLQEVNFSGAAQHGGLIGSVVSAEPNPGSRKTGVVLRVFVRDPDGLAADSALVKTTETSVAEPVYFVAAIATLTTVANR